MKQIEWCKNKIVEQEQEFKITDLYLQNIVPLERKTDISSALL